MRRSLSALILPALIPVVLVAAIPAPAAPAHEPAASNFEGFLQELWVDAQAQGIARATFDTAFAGLAPDPRVIAATSRQPEYGKPAGDYVNSIASRGRIDAGIQQVRKWSDTFAAVEKKFGIARWVLLGLWGIETSYGADKDRWDVIRSLATLAQARYRDPYFRNELLVALRILQDGHVARQKLVGSWAGAMGQPQFMPSNFYDYAVDFSGNGRPDIWTNVPDVLASMANYLRKEGWSPGLTWGFEVIVPTDFDYRRSRASLQNWSELGLRRADGGAFPQAGDAILFFPSGAAGPAFLVTTNFSVIKRYNDSDIYALAVLHLADRISGRAPIRAAWPADDRQLSRADASPCKESWPSSAMPYATSRRISISTLETRFARSRRNSACDPTVTRLRPCWSASEQGEGAPLAALN